MYYNHNTDADLMGAEQLTVFKQASGVDRANGDNLVDSVIAVIG
jgi:hypothetical protein